MEMKNKMISNGFRHILFTSGLICLLFSCGQISPEQASPAAMYLPLDPHDSMYLGKRDYACDTLTDGGWKIEYLVKNDSSRYSDLYIRWSDGKSSRLYAMASVLDLRDYFIPTYVGENETHLFLEHACASECNALLLLPKSSGSDVKSFVKVCDYNIGRGIVVYDTLPGYEWNRFELMVADLQQNTEKTARFSHLCYSEFGGNCLDSIVYHPQKVDLHATLTDVNDPDREKQIREKITVELR